MFKNLSRRSQLLEIEDRAFCMARKAAALRNNEERLFWISVADFCSKEADALAPEVAA